MKKFIYAFFILASLLSGDLVVLAKSGKMEQISQTFGLTGKWRSKCLSVDFMGLKRARYEYDFGIRGGYKRTEQYFQDLNCDNNHIAFTYVAEGKIQEIGKVEGSENIFNVNLTVANQEVDIHSQLGATWFNDNLICATEAWLPHERYVLTANTCPHYAFEDNHIIFDMYRNDGNQLVFGRSSFFRPKERINVRPTILNNDIVYFP